MYLEPFSHRWEIAPAQSVCANINFSASSAQWREKLGSGINSAELVRAVRLAPDEAAASNDRQQPAGEPLPGGLLDL